MKLLIISLKLSKSTCITHEVGGGGGVGGGGSGSWPW